MYKKILVPLDGSELSESILPHVVNLAKGCRVPEVVLQGLPVNFHFPFSSGHEQCALTLHRSAH